MNYPTNIPDWRNALLAYSPAEDHADAIYEAQSAASPVVAAVAAFGALKSAQSLTGEGLSVLLGAAHLIAAGGWHGLAGEAATLIGRRAAEFAAMQPGSHQDWAAPEPEHGDQEA